MLCGLAAQGLRTFTTSFSLRPNPPPALPLRDLPMAVSCALLLPLDLSFHKKGAWEVACHEIIARISWLEVPPSNKNTLPTSIRLCGKGIMLMP